MEYPELFDNFERPDGAPGIAVSGHAWVISGSPLPTIVNGELGTLTPGTGGYSFTDLMQHPKHQYVDVVWTAIDGVVVLMGSNRDNSLTHTTHLWFSGQGYLFQVRENSGGFDILASADYPALVELGKTYRIGVRYNGPCLTMEFPDGTERTVCSPRFANVSGRYLCFQTDDTARILNAWCTVQNRLLVK